MASFSIGGNWTFTGATALSSGTSVLNLTTTSGQLNINSGSGNILIDSSTGSIQIGEHGTPTSVSIGSNAATTSIEGTATQIYGNTSIDMDAPTITIADVTCTSLTIASNLVTTYLNLPVPPGTNNTPLLIDTDGRIHV